MMAEQNIPAGELVRSGVVGLTAAKVGLKEVEYLAKKMFTSKENKQALKENNEEEIAKMIFKSLSLLRGTALKVAQVLSMEVDILPESIQKELSQSCYKAPPLNRALIRKTITSRLGKLPEKIFSSFQSQPFAAASLGQVHLAEVENKKQVAVKVQYPGIDQTIESDVKLLRKILKMLPYKALDQNIASEIEARLKEELDYELEAERTRWFKKNLVSDWIKIPEVMTALSNQTILVTEMLQGLHLEEWLKNNPSQDERNHFGQLLADIFYFCLFDLNIVHADPNPGNYLFDKNGKLGIIDFGSVKEMPSKHATGFKQLFEYVRNKDLPNIKVMYEKLGFVLNNQYRKENSELDEGLRLWIDWFSKPFNTSSYDFGQNPQFLIEGYKVGKIMRFFFKQINSDFIFLDRALLGLYRFLIRIGANVNMQLDRDYML